MDMKQHIKIRREALGMERGTNKVGTKTDRVQAVYQESGHCSSHLNDLLDLLVVG